MGQLVRRNDPDRFFTALFAPANKRETLFALYAFNHELARAREVTREPAIALIRLQWWREVVEGASRSHDIAIPLHEALGRGDLLAGDLAKMIDAREIEAEPFIPTLNDWLTYLRGTAGTLAVAAARLLGDGDAESVGPLGTAYGVAGVLRAVALLASYQRCLLPADVLTAHNLSPEEAIAAPNNPPVHAAIADLARKGQELLRGHHRLPRPGRPAALVGVFARRDLRRLPHVRRRDLADRLAVIRSWVTGRL